MRIYTGSEGQLPDPTIAAVESHAPAYRGIAYVVMENLQLAQFGNRAPQFTFEVSRPAQPGDEISDISSSVQAVALLPGSGEYALATTKVRRELGFGRSTLVNVNTNSGRSDFKTSIDNLRDALPKVGSVSLIVSWFGDDLRCGSCQIRPKVEQDDDDPEAMPWTVAGKTRSSARLVPRKDGVPVYGGTPSDDSVIEAIQHLKKKGQDVVFYPFILMDQLVGNALPDPYGGSEQAVLPWRGRITASLAPGVDGSPDGSAEAADQVAAFFGTAKASDFNGLSYSGPAEWSFRRFILHQAALCRKAGGVGAFCIGSEMRGLTWLRGASNSFPAVEQMIALTAEVRALLGPETKLSYAADWSEYFGYQPQDGSGDRFFHLDPLWADENIDFVGIDNYMPLSDWRDGVDHADADAGSIYSLDYLEANVAGGEGYDWFYPSSEARDAQLRSPITDGAHGEPWVYRYKDIRGWWENQHHDRIGGQRLEEPTDWEIASKPIWFTELGCPAVDKGTNQPNKFIDSKSSESKLPYYSNGLRDDLIQMNYLRAVHAFYGAAANNPVSPVYGGRMIDMARAHVWAWDARPFPAFPGRTDIWSDGDNWRLGHWITGRASARPLAAVVAEICQRAGIADYDVSGLHGLVRGYQIDQVGTGRAALQPLQLAYGFDAVERDGTLIFADRDGRVDGSVAPERLAVTDETPGGLELSRAPEAEVTGRVRVSYVEDGGSYEIAASEAVFPDEETIAVSTSEVPLVLTRGEGRAVAERWLAEARLARDTARFALPPSRFDLGAGDVVDLGDAGQFRIDRSEQTTARQIEAVRVEPESYLRPASDEEAPVITRFVPPVPVVGTFLDLPLISGDEVPHQPHFASTAEPWPGAAALYSSASGSDYRLELIAGQAAVIGITETAMAAATPGVLDRGAGLRVRLVRGSLSSAQIAALLSGGNLAAIGDGGTEAWELFQFASAELIAPDLWELSLRLRGQAGSDGLMPAAWPAGSQVVVMNRAVQQVPLAEATRGVARTYRFGPAIDALSDESFRETTLAFAGNGLRPYPVCHLRGTEAAGDMLLQWIRRTRIGGDSWEGEVPLGEAVERYRVEISRGSETLRSVEVSEPCWTYGAADRVSDGPGVTISVAQISERFGPGPSVGMAL